MPVVELVVLFENADIAENAENVLKMLFRDVVVVAMDVVELRSEAGPVGVMFVAIDVLVAAASGGAGGEGGVGVV